MFQVGALIVFGGLLTQSTAQLGGLPLPQGQALPLPLGQGLPLHLAQGPPSYMTPPLPLRYRDPASSLVSGFTSGLLSGGLLGILENLPLLNILKPGGGTSGGLLGGLLGSLTSGIPLLNIIDLKITNPQLLELGLVQSPDGHRLYVTIPLGLDLDVKLLMFTSLLEVNLKLNITAEVLAVRNSQGRVHLVLGDCLHSPGNLHISLLNGGTPLSVQNLLDGITDILNKVLPELVQDKVCPLVNEVLSHLDVTLVHDIAELLLHGIQFVIKI